MKERTEGPLHSPSAKAAKECGAESGRRRTNNVEVSDDPNDGNHSDCSTVDSEKYLKSNIQSYGSNHIGEVSIKEKPEKHFDKPGLSVISCNELDQS